MTIWQLGDHKKVSVQWKTRPQTLVKKKNEQSSEYVHLPDFGMHRRCSTKEDRILHKILNAWAFNLLQEVAIRLLPCSVVDLHNVSSHGPARNISLVDDTEIRLTTPEPNVAGVLLAIKRQLLFNGAVNNTDEVDVPAEEKHQESLSLRQYTHHQDRQLKRGNHYNKIQNRDSNSLLTSSFLM